MKKWLLSLALGLSGIVSVHAADLPAKARALQPALIPATGCGMYWGIHTEGGAGAVSGSPVPGASIIQAEVGGHIGYTCANTDMSFWFVEANVSAVNANGATNGFSFRGPIDMLQRVGYGNPAAMQFISQLFPGLGSISTPSLPVLPAGVTAGPAAPYVYAGVREQDVSADFLGFDSGKIWAVSPEIGVGMWYRLSNGVVADVSAGYTMRSSGACINSPIGSLGCPGIGDMWRARVGFNF